ncbi:hypothetical protein, partial [Klebsiella pneumoniae]|uniref:hypothetical protein n=1 Tax=Klebsiella pneumoniae TaxID=573 RepID=UPI00200BC0C5
IEKSCKESCSDEGFNLLTQKSYEVVSPFIVMKIRANRIGERVETHLTEIRRRIGKTRAEANTGI